MRLLAVSLLAATLLWPGLPFAEEAITVLPTDPHRTELDAVTRDIALTKSADELRREIDSLDKDQATLTRSLSTPASR